MENGLPLFLRKRGCLPYLLCTSDGHVAAQIRIVRAEQHLSEANDVNMLNTGGLKDAAVPK